MTKMRFKCTKCGTVFTTKKIPDLEFVGTKEQDLIELGLSRFMIFRNEIVEPLLRCPSAYPCHGTGKSNSLFVALPVNDEA